MENLGKKFSDIMKANGMEKLLEGDIFKRRKHSKAVDSKLELPGKKSAGGPDDEELPPGFTDPYDGE